MTLMVAMGGRPRLRRRCLHPQLRPEALGIVVGAELVGNPHTGPVAGVAADTLGTTRFDAWARSGDTGVPLAATSPCGPEGEFEARQVNPSLVNRPQPFRVDLRTGTLIADRRPAA
jgi:hypothetical protein